MNAPTNYYTRLLGEASASGLSRFRESPLTYLDWTQNPTDNPTPPMREGTAFHMAIHEPERFARTYIEIPVMALRSREDKEEFLMEVFRVTGVPLIFEGENAEDLRSKVVRELKKTGAQVLTSESLATLRGMARSLNMGQHAEPRSIVARGKKEVEFRWKDGDSGLQCKARLDSWDAELGILSDLKRTAAITARGFRREVLTRGYHFQMAFYRRALREAGESPKYCCFTCGCPTGPLYPWALYDLPEEVLDACDEQLSRDLLSLAECVSKNDWPSLNGGKATTLDIRSEYI